MRVFSFVPFPVHHQTVFNCVSCNCNKLLAFLNAVLFHMNYDLSSMTGHLTSYALNLMQFMGRKPMRYRLPECHLGL